MGAATDILRLAWWLGPWSVGRSPAGVEHADEWVPMGASGASVRVRVHAPARPPTGALLLAPGLHFLGPDHPDLDRFARGLATAGTLVMTPFLTDFMRLHLAARAFEEFTAAFDALRAHPRRPAGVKPGIWSISVGSSLALRVAGDPERAEHVGGVVTFGGFGSWADTVRFAMSGTVAGQKEVEPDLRTAPVLFLQMAPVLDLPEAGREALSAAWRSYIELSWLPEVSKEPEALRPLVERVAADVPVEHRELFLQGCGMHPGGAALVDAALDELDFSFLEPSPASLAAMRCPAYLMHGVDDDVIHHSQLDVIARMLPERVHQQHFRTGMFGHSGGKAGAGVGAAVTELTTTVGMIRAMYAAARQRRDA